MSGENIFDLEDLEPDPKPSPKPAPAPKPASVLKRTPARKRVARPTRAEHAAPGGKRGKAARFLGWIVAQRFYYAASFFITTGVLLALYNPSWGAAAKAWPHEALGLGGTCAWDLATARLLALVVLALALLVATFGKTGRWRGALVVIAACLVITAYQDVGPFAAVGGLALAGGALLTPRGARRTAVLSVGLALLAAHLFMPWAAERFTRGIDIAPSYQATAFDTIDALAAPKDGVVEAKGWDGIIFEHLEPAIALLLAAIGLLALVGAGGRWARWAAGALLVLLCVGTLAQRYLEGAAGADDALQAGAVAAAGGWFALAAAYVLGLAAAVADLAVDREA